MTYSIASASSRARRNTFPEREKSAGHRFDGRNGVPSPMSRLSYRSTYRRAFLTAFQSTHRDLALLSTRGRQPEFDIPRQKRPACAGSVPTSWVGAD